MNIKVSYRNLEPTEAIRAVTQKKSEKLKKYFDGNFNLSWSFTIEKQSHIAHCHITGKNIDYFAEAQTSLMYESIENVVNALGRQLQDRKEQLKNHHIKDAKLARSVA